MTTDSCEECSSMGPIHRHHRDGNPFNNVQENFISLCVKCHGAAHRKMRDDGSAPKHPRRNAHFTGHARPGMVHLNSRITEIFGHCVIGWQYGNIVVLASASADLKSVKSSLDITLLGITHRIEKGEKEYNEEDVRRFMTIGYNNELHNTLEELRIALSMDSHLSVLEECLARGIDSFIKEKLET